METLKQNNERRKVKSKEKILSTIANNENIVNKKAIECITILKTTKDKNNEQFTNNLYQLASIIIQSKLKNIQKDDKKYREETALLKSQIGQLFHHSKDEFNNIPQRNVYLQQLENLFVVGYNKNGERVVTCKNKEEEKKIIQRLEKMTRLETAEELLQDIVCMLWKYIAETLEKISYNYDELETDILQDCCLLKEFETVKLHTTTYQNGKVKPVELWETTFTNPIKESTKTVARIIENKKAIKETNIPYQEIETTIYNPLTEEEETFTKYKKVTSLTVTDTFDYNGKQFAQTVDNETINLIDKILETANFTKNQAYIFRKIFCDGHSVDSLADKMKVRNCYIEKELAKIKQKAVDTGIFKSVGYTDNAPVDNSKKPQKIACYDVTDEQNRIFICFFESVGKASKILLIDKSNISKVLKGRRKQVNGFYFEYVTE